jgi:hypothetical protein
VDFAKTGNGAVGIVPPLRPDENLFAAQQVARAKKLGAVGELNLCDIANDNGPLNIDIEDLWFVSATLRTTPPSGPPTLSGRRTFQF